MLVVGNNQKKRKERLVHFERISVLCSERLNIRHSSGYLRDMARRKQKEGRAMG